jgi:hypothetical protein
MSTHEPQDAQNPSTAKLMVVGLLALGAALTFIYVISP